MLVEWPFKYHLGILYPSAAEFTAFSGEVATWTGVVTGVLMLASPLLFEHLGWRGVANTTPRLLLWGGCSFFTACIAYQQLYGTAAAAAMSGGAAAAAVAGLPLLQAVVMGGALTYVFSKSAKFSLFKPAEEMVRAG